MPSTGRGPAICSIDRIVRLRVSVKASARRSAPRSALVSERTPLSRRSGPSFNLALTIFSCCSARVPRLPDSVHVSIKLPKSRGRRARALTFCRSISSKKACTSPTPDCSAKVLICTLFIGSISYNVYVVFIDISLELEGFKDGLFLILPERLDEGLFG